MLAEQGIDVEQLASLNQAAFTTSLSTFDQMVAALEQRVEAEAARMQREIDRDFNRLVESLVQDAGRAAESVAITARPNVQHVRHLNLPSCSRCVVLAGRIYRYSEGFLRHPGCDCVMIPVAVASSDLTYDPEALARDGSVTGLSKADLRALLDGADFNQVINVRNRKAGLTESGRVLARAGRPTPEGIYRLAPDDREEAIRLLKQAGYLR